MDGIIKRRKEILEWEKNNRNLTTRSAPKNGLGCFYLNPDGGPGCAVGRLIEDKELCRELDKIGFLKDAWPQIPKDIQALGYEFLDALQRFHDNEGNFREDGLSVQGETFINSLLNSYT